MKNEQNNEHDNEQTNEYKLNGIEHEIDHI